MGSVNLNEIVVTPLRLIETKGGDVMHAIKQRDPGYFGFGEAYFSWVECGAVKAWKRHTRMTMNVVVPVGQVRFVFWRTDNEGVGEFRVEEIGVNRYARITVPPGFWFGFQGITVPQSLILNVANIPHDPTEVERMELSEIDYFWN